MSQNSTPSDEIDLTAGHTAPGSVPPVQTGAASPEAMDTRPSPTSAPRAWESSETDLQRALKEALREEFRELQASLLKEVRTQLAPRAAGQSALSPSPRRGPGSKDQADVADRSLCETSGVRFVLEAAQTAAGTPVGGSISANTVGTGRPKPPPALRRAPSAGEVGAAARRGSTTGGPSIGMLIKSSRVDDYKHWLKEMDEACQDRSTRKANIAAVAPLGEEESDNDRDDTKSRGSSDGLGRKVPSNMSDTNPLAVTVGTSSENHMPSPLSPTSSVQVPQVPKSPAARVMIDASSIKSEETDGEAIHSVISGMMKGTKFRSKSSFDEELSMGIWRARAAVFVRSTRFEALSMVMIFLSAVHIGLQTDHMAQNMLSKPALVYRVFDLIFMFFFLLELLLRLFVFRRRYFTMWGWQWNILDLVLVGFQVIEEITLLVESEDSSPLSSRLLRIVRVLRAVRVIRILHATKFAEELRLLVSCVAHSARSFHWAAALILLMIYVVSVHITQLTLFQRLEMTGAPITPGASLAQSGVETGGLYGKPLEVWYGSVPRSMLSLFQGLTGGIDWDELTQPLIEQLSPWAGVAFALYMAFAVLAVMNVITGTFVQNAMERAAQNNEMRKVSQARRLFNKLDRTREGVITFAELACHLEDSAVVDFFKSIDVDVSDARHLFDMLDSQNTGRISFDDFLGGCMRLHGPAKALDLVLVMRELKESVSMLPISEDATL